MTDSGVEPPTSLRVRQVERVALLDVAGLEPFAEPGDALAAGAVGEGVGDDVALSLFLDSVVADRGGGAQGFFQITGLEDLLRSLGVVGPDAGVEVGLELEADR